MDMVSSIHNLSTDFILKHHFFFAP
jgi:hypothetical protein